MSAFGERYQSDLSRFFIFHDLVTLFWLFIVQKAQDITPLTNLRLTPTFVLNAFVTIISPSGSDYSKRSDIERDGGIHNLQEDIESNIDVLI